MERVPQMLMRLAPALFVILWSTGFIGSRLGASDAEPFTFLTIRFLLVLLALLPVWLVMRKEVLEWHKRGHAVVVGALIHGVYLGGVFWAIHQRMPAGVAALIVSMQPVLTTIFVGRLLGERVAGRHLLSLALGFVGVLLVLAPKMQSAIAFDSGITMGTILATSLALFGMTAGTIYQKRFATDIDLMTGSLWQYIGALGLVAVGSLLIETREVNWTPQFTFALGWLVFVLSIGAIFLLMVLIRSSAVSTVSNLFFLVPGVTAIIAYFMFGETLEPIQLAGFVLATIAVFLTSSRTEKTPC